MILGLDRLSNSHRQWVRDADLADNVTSRFAQRRFQTSAGTLKQWQRTAQAEDSADERDRSEPTDEHKEDSGSVWTLSGTPNKEGPLPGRTSERLHTGEASRDRGRGTQPTQRGSTVQEDKCAQKTAGKRSHDSRRTGTGTPVAKGMERSSTIVEGSVLASVPDLRQQLDGVVAGGTCGDSDTGRVDEKVGRAAVHTQLPSRTNPGGPHAAMARRPSTSGARCHGNGDNGRGHQDSPGLLECTDGHGDYRPATSGDSGREGGMDGAARVEVRRKQDLSALLGIATRGTTVCHGVHGSDPSAHRSSSHSNAQAGRLPHGAIARGDEPAATDRSSQYTSGRRRMGGSGDLFRGTSTKPAWRWLHCRPGVLRAPRRQPSPGAPHREPAQISSRS